MEDVQSAIKRLEKEFDGQNIDFFLRKRNDEFGNQIYFIKCNINEYRQTMDISYKHDFDHEEAKSRIENAIKMLKDRNERHANLRSTENMIAGFKNILSKFQADFNNVDFSISLKSENKFPVVVAVFGDRKHQVHFDLLNYYGTPVLAVKYDKVKSELETAISVCSRAR